MQTEGAAPMSASPSSPAESKSTSRRALLAAAGGAAAAFAARAIAGPTNVLAADTGPINIGGTYGDVQAQTTLGNQATNDIVLWIASNSGSGFGGGTALVGYSDHGIGVQGQTALGGTGVRGISSSGNGVYGTSTYSYGVYAESGSGDGIYATSNGGYGVRAFSSNGAGVSGQSNSFFGVRGSSTSNYGVYGSSTSKAGVYGSSSATDHPGTVGQSGGNSTGVLGYSGSASLPAARAKTGVYGYAAQDNFSRGVIGESPAGIGLYGITSSGYAGYFAGRVFTTKWYEMTEVSTPAAPSANRLRLFARDNGSGLTQLCVRFNSGTVKVLATQT
jgi:hypothetical protein